MDGETNSPPRDTDCWWERHRQDRLKTFTVYQDVLMDIEEYLLTDEEKRVETEKVTSLRKEALGSNYIFCPPWN